MVPQHTELTAKNMANPGRVSSNAIVRRCSSYVAYVQDRARAFNAIARSSPYIILGVPLLTFLVLAAAGTIAVVFSARSAGQHSRDSALALARGAASQYRQQLAFASSAAEVLAAVVRANPSYDRVSLRFNATAPALVNTAPSGSISSLRLFPSGRLRMVYPLAEAAVNMLGYDALADQGVEKNAAGGNPYADTLQFVGPLPPLPGREAEGPLLLVRRAIYVPLPADLNDDFGRPDPPNPACGDPCTFNLTRGTVFWGLVVSEVMVRALDSSSAMADASTPSQSGEPSLTPAASALRALSGVGYAYRLTAGNGVLVAASGEETPRDPVSTDLDLPGSVWQLQVWRHAGSWTPPWFGGALAAAIVLSAVAALLLGRMLVSRRRHAMLLEALLPRDLLKELSATHAETLGPAGPLDAASSPAGLLLELLGSLLEGAAPDLRQVVLLRSLALRQADWYQPLGVAQAIKGARLENDVARALMRQLGTTTGVDSDVTSSMLDLGQGEEQQEYGVDGRAATDLKWRGHDATGGGGGKGAVAGAASGDMDIAADRKEQQGPQLLDTMRGALAFVLSPEAQGLPRPPSGPHSLAAEANLLVTASGPLPSPRCRSNGTASGGLASSSAARRRRPSQLLSLPAGGCSIDMLCADLAAAAEMLETTDEVESSAFGPLRSCQQLMLPPAPVAALQQPQQQQQPHAQSPPVQQHHAGNQPVVFQPGNSLSFAGMVMHRTTDGSQPRQGRRIGWRSQHGASTPGCLAQTAAVVSAAAAARGGPAAAAHVDSDCSAAAPVATSSGTLLLTVASGLLVGRRAPSMAASSAAGSPRALPALPTAAEPMRHQHSQPRAQTPTHPSLLAPSASAGPSDAAILAAAAAADGRHLHSLPLQKVTAPAPVVQTGSAAAAGDASQLSAHAGGAGGGGSGGTAGGAAASSSGGGGGRLERARCGSADTAYESNTLQKAQWPQQQQLQQEGASPRSQQEGASPRSQPASATSARALQQQASGSGAARAAGDAAAGAASGPAGTPQVPSSPAHGFIAQLATVARWPGTAAAAAAAAASRKVSSTDDDGSANRGAMEVTPCTGGRRQKPLTLRPQQGAEVGPSGLGEAAAVAASEVEVEAGEVDLHEDVRHAAVRAQAAVSSAPPAALLDQIEVLLAGAHEWQFDTWALAEASGGHALSVMGFYLMQREGLVAAFRIPAVRLARLLRALEDGYPASNPYHNATHAADVLRTLSVLLRGARLTAHFAHGLGLLASYFAAIIHDHGHPGLTGDFLVATSHPLALRYNDRSPLESHHAASAFTLLAERPDLDAFSELSKEQRSAFRKQVVDMVLATDMKQHFSLLAQFTALQKARKAGLSAGGAGRDLLGSSGKGQLTAAGGDTPRDESSSGHGAQQAQRQPLAATRAGVILSTGGNASTELGPDASRPSSSSLQRQSSQPLVELVAPVPQDDVERSLTLQIALKAADIGHLAGALPVHCRWLGVLEEEFFRQGDRERDLGLPISPLFDRAKQGVSKSQVGFFDFVALPLVRALVEAFPGAAQLAACFERNYNHWKQVEAEAAAQRQA
ncbi:hypothetical protein HYH02_008169 [Chlamydomonas schloesseri]|uniref:PDEase domain-containing protein n=1 Tax=Chlamydomonas schloesseri TaxID=2026947 RepID=A0A835WH16_9CHLO|nr:hypothetical protein HYH02_008169 [Chlamydomonas schloesseri]|eukprot:KAG2447016.1 hypothetical protein HYH02_008169 [Chlamydomonas schloesseri]